MNRIVVSRDHPDYEIICDLNPTYDYKFNKNYSCVEVDDDFFLIIKLKYNLSINLSLNGISYSEYSDMPTYVIQQR